MEDLCYDIADYFHAAGSVNLLRFVQCAFQQYNKSGLCCCDKVHFMPGVIVHIYCS